MPEDFECGFKCGEKSCHLKMAISLDDVILLSRKGIYTSSDCDKGSCPFYQNYLMLKRITEHRGME